MYANSICSFINFTRPYKQTKLKVNLLLKIALLFVYTMLSILLVDVRFVMFTCKRKLSFPPQITREYSTPSSNFRCHLSATLFLRSFPISPVKGPRRSSGARAVAVADVSVDRTAMLEKISIEKTEISNTGLP